jgi:hypothetical protein
VRGAARPDGEEDTVLECHPDHQPRVSRARFGQHLVDEGAGAGGVARNVRRVAEHAEHVRHPGGVPRRPGGGQASLEVGDRAVVVAGVEGEQPGAFKHPRAQRRVGLVGPRQRRLDPLNAFP